MNLYIMKPIKVDNAQSLALGSALDAANGKAGAHTAAIDDVFNAAREAETRLADLRLPKAARAGAKFSWTSGDKLPNAYARRSKTVIRTRLTLERRSASWYLVDAHRFEDWATKTPTSRLLVTPEQDCYMIAALRAEYGLLDQEEAVT
jgi:hypothetical protein